MELNNPDKQYAIQETIRKSAESEQDYEGELRNLAQELDEEGILASMPDNVYPGMPYVLARTAIKSGKIRYSLTHINNLARKNLIEAVRVGDQLLLPLRGYKQLLDRQRKSLAGELRRGGQPPGGTVYSGPDHHRSS